VPVAQPPLTRADLQTLSRLRRREAASLRAAGQLAGCYYLLGYAVECALKACIAKNVPRNTMPQRNAKDLYVHNLTDLRKFALLDIEMDGNAAVQLNWLTVKDWTEQSRYYPVTESAVVQDFYSACTARTNGVLPWIARRW